MVEQFEYSQVINLPVEKVFHFFAVEHVRNHPRWDPDIQLSLDSDDPIGVGTVIHRINRRSGTPVEGTMEVTEFKPNQAMGVLIHDGPVSMRSRVSFERVGDHQTNMTTYIEIDLPSMDESMKAFLNSRLERSGKNMKQLMEIEV